MLRDPTDLIWRKWIPFKAMIGRTAPSSDGLLAEVFRGFLSFKENWNGPLKQYASLRGIGTGWGLLERPCE